MVPLFVSWATFGPILDAARASRQPGKILLVLMDPADGDVIFFSEAYVMFYLFVGFMALWTGPLGVHKDIQTRLAAAASGTGAQAPGA